MRVFLCISVAMRVAVVAEWEDFSDDFAFSESSDPFETETSWDNRQMESKAEEENKAGITFTSYNVYGMRYKLNGVAVNQNSIIIF